MAVVNNVNNSYAVLIVIYYGDRVIQGNYF